MLSHCRPLLFVPWPQTKSFMSVISSRQPFILGGRFEVLLGVLLLYVSLQSKAESMSICVLLCLLIPNPEQLSSEFPVLNLCLFHTACVLPTELQPQPRRGAAGNIMTTGKEPNHKGQEIFWCGFCDMENFHSWFAGKLQWAYNIHVFSVCIGKIMTAHPTTYKKYLIL